MEKLIKLFYRLIKNKLKVDVKVFFRSFNVKSDTVDGIYEICVIYQDMSEQGLVGSLTHSPSTSTNGSRVAVEEVSLK